MDMSLDEGQAALENSISRFLADNYSFEQRNGWLTSEDGFNAEYWKQYAELGWLALPFAESEGGLGGTAVETMILMQQFGKALVLEPYLATVILGGGLLRHASEARRAEWLGALIAGELRCAFAFAEQQSRYNIANVQLEAEKTSGGWKLTGDKTVVLDGHVADLFVVSARTSGGPTDSDGISLFAISADAPGVSRRSYRTFDDRSAAELSLQGVAVSEDDLVGGVGEGTRLASRALQSGILGLGAEAVGGMEVMHADTLEYSRTREQFGAPIGAFQVLQHRMVDMFMEVEQSRSILYMTAIRLAEDGDEAAAEHAVSALKAQTGKAGRFVAQQAVQTHGGMGVTEELRLSHYFKRLTAIEQTFGNTDFHLRRFARSSPPESP